MSGEPSKHSVAPYADEEHDKEVQKWIEDGEMARKPQRRKREIDQFVKEAEGPVRTNVNKEDVKKSVEIF